MATARPDADKEDTVIETWEAVTAASTWVWAYSRRKGEYEKIRVGGGGSKRLEISRDCRKYNQSLIPDENIMLDPFTNGSLTLVRCQTEDESLVTKYHMNDLELIEYFKVNDPDLFLEAIGEIQSEVILRRLLAMSETQGRMFHVEALRNLVADRYSVGGQQRTIRELDEAERRAASAR